MGTGADEALYLRKRLLRLHGLNKILIPKKKWIAIEECLLEKTSEENVVEVARRVLPETFTQETALKVEFALVESYGAERYADGELLRKHVNEALVRFRINLMMNVIYESCGFKMTGTVQDLLESAADSAGMDRGHGF